MKFLVGYKVDGGEFITIVEVSEDEANLREIESKVRNKMRNFDIEVKNWVPVKKKLFEKDKQYLIKFQYDHITDIQMEIVYAKNMIDAMEIFENVCKRPDRYFIKSVERL